MFREKLTYIYCIYLYEDEKYFYIKIGQSNNPSRRLATYKSIAPNAYILTSQYFPLNKEKELIDYLENQNFNKIYTELFKIEKNNVQEFINSICFKLKINGYNIANFSKLTGCLFSHYRNELDLDRHRDCSNKCHYKLKLAEWHKKHNNLKDVENLLKEGNL